MADDPCECLLNHETAMQRLLSLAVRKCRPPSCIERESDRFHRPDHMWCLQLRDAQAFCTDTECPQDGLGPAPNGGLMMWTMLWGAIALALFFLRPNSLRAPPAEPQGKGGRSGGRDGHPRGDDGGAPPPGVL